MRAEGDGGRRGDSFPEPSLADLEAVAAFTEALCGSDMDLGHWAGGASAREGYPQVPWFQTSNLISQWEQALYERNIITSYGEDGWFDRMHAFSAEPDSLASADLLTIRKVLTTIVRGERFCDGHIQGMFSNGVAQAAMARLSKLIAIRR